MSGSRIHRLLRLVTILQGGTPLSAVELAERLGISRRTLFRDLEALREAGIPYKFDPERGYRIEQGFFLPPINLRVNEALGLMLLAKVAEGHRNQPFFKAAAEAIGKVATQLPEPYRDVTIAMMEHVTVAPGEPAVTSADNQGRFVALQKAMSDRAVVRMTYRSLFDGTTIESDLHPYHLHFAKRDWYVIGFSAMHDEVRTFKLERIEALEETDRRFRPDPRFSIDDYLGLAWALIPEGDVHDVELVFEPTVAQNVAEVKWHKTQRHTMEPDGRCRVHFHVDGLNEITWWLLGYGDQVYVEAPDALRDKLAEVHQSAADHLMATSGGP